MGQAHSQQLRKRVDLRNEACLPYPGVDQQGEDITCVTRALSFLIHCEKNKQGYVVLPYTQRAYPNFNGIFRAALGESPRPDIGISFDSVLEKIKSSSVNHDLEILGVVFKRLDNHLPNLWKVLDSGRAIAAGYLVNQEISDFHRNFPQKRTQRKSAEWVFA